MRRLISGVVMAAACLAGPLLPSWGDDEEPAPRLGPQLRVVATYPPEGGAGLFTDTVVVRFNRPVDPASVTASSVRLMNQTLVVPGTTEVGVDADGNPEPRTMVWRPVSPLLASGSWRLEISRAVRTLRGREILDPYSLVFTTNGMKDKTVYGELEPGQRLSRAKGLGPAPKVRFTFPQAGLGNVYTDEVAIRFTQDMDTSALLDGTFTVLQGGKPLAGTVSFPEDWSGRQVVFHPDKPLFRDTNFQMVVTRNARTVRGRYLQAEYRAGFGTSPFKGGVKPIRPEDFVDEFVAPLPEGRAFHTTTALPGGQLVVAGGQDYAGGPLSTCYLVSGGAVSPIASMNTARRKHAAVATRDGGVMVVGGFGPTGTTLSSAEVYNPGTNTWNLVAPLASSRANHTATVVAGTRILVVGGFTTDTGSLTYAPGAELFNPFTGAWSATAGSPVSQRGGHTETLLPDGRVLLAGGNISGALQNEVYLPGSDTFTATSQPRYYRMFHAACLTKSGRVLLAGGGPAMAEQFDPSNGNFREAGACPPIGLPVSSGPLFSTLTLIPGGGRIALIGGLVPGGGEGGGDLVLAQVQIWDPAGAAGEGAFYPMLFDLKVPRAAHTVNQAADGSYVIVGGFGTSGLTNVAEVTVFRPSQ